VKGTVDAVFENGVFRPVEHPNLAEGQRVRLIVESVPKASPADVLQLARRVYEGLSASDIDEVEDMARHRRLFDDVEP
jgi:predicted DNA-binding antitoxin AbrB/MazE fold protein